MGLAHWLFSADAYVDCALPGSTMIDALAAARARRTTWLATLQR